MDVRAGRDGNASIGAVEKASNVGGVFVKSWTGLDAFFRRGF